MALTGFIHGNTCYSTSAEALNAHYNDIPATVIANGNTVFYQLNNLGTQWQRVELTPLNVATFANALTPHFTPCDPSAGFSDGILLAALVGGAMIIASVWGITSKAR